MTQPPVMQEFRIEMTEDGICHLIFDAPGRSMNVFSNRAIHEAEAFADWLKNADVKGVLVRSGKSSAFCAGADLGELSTAFDMIMATPKAERDAFCLKEYSPIGRAFRKLETAGKPVAVAVHGLALGGGCELILACHYKVVTDAPETQLGLPESLVGLLPGGGGTQRLPRLVGIEASLPILLEGGRYSAKEAVELGCADELVAQGDEVAAAEAWIRSGPEPRQPWDKAGWTAPNAQAVLAETAPARAVFLARTGGHYPAEIAILDCLDRGLVGDMNFGIAEEIDIFKDLIQRSEARNMIQVQFLGRVDYDRAKRKDAFPERLNEFVTNIKSTLAGEIHDLGALGAAAARFAGIAPEGGALSWEAGDAAAIAARRPQWFEAPETETERAALKILAHAAMAAGTFSHDFETTTRRLADYAATRKAGFPVYLGGPFSFLDHFGLDALRRMMG
jgi:3-hydroxyacyl-CoA dehydrogenase/enoyl-CoA hydratase/3-hydroxybutyryl-CoA epimerase